MAGYVDEFKNLELHDARVQVLVNRLLKGVDATLERNILNDSTLAKAKSEVRSAYQVALMKTDFVNELEKSTVSVIVNSSFVESTVKMSKSEYSNKLLKQKLIDGDSLTMSRRIRKNTTDIIETQQKILFEGLQAGKTTVKLTRDIKNAEIFEEALPKYLNDLVNIRVNGNRVLTAKEINSAKIQISKLKTKGLKRDYDRLANKLITNKPFENAIKNAISSKTRQLSYRVTQNQTHATIAEFKNDTAMQDDNTKYVKTEIYGEETCAYCLGIYDLGYVPVGNATLPPHHPHCDCQAKYKKTVRDVEPWTKEEYMKKATEAVNKRNEKNVNAGVPKTYIKIQEPENLREKSLTERLNNTK